VLQLLALAGVRFSLNYYDSSVHFALGRPDIRMKLLLMHTTANVVAFLIAVQYGIVAVAAAFVLRTYLLAPVDLFVLTRLLPMRFTEYLRQLVTPLVCCVLMAIAVLAVQSVLSGWAGLLVGTVTGVVTYGLALRLVSANSFDEVVGIIREVVQPS
jgi:PST family polysaccharide transporter